MRAFAPHHRIHGAQFKRAKVTEVTDKMLLGAIATAHAAHGVFVRDAAVDACQQAGVIMALGRDTTRIGAWAGGWAHTLNTPYRRNMPPPLPQTCGLPALTRTCILPSHCPRLRR